MVAKCGYGKEPAEVYYEVLVTAERRKWSGHESESRA
jgi:hypothetical protein